MHRCFTSVVDPALAALRPRVIVEVGAGAGRLTRRLLDSPHAMTATVHAIDPVPRLDPEQLATDHPRLVVHHERSVDVLPRLTAVDLVLLDGDPNHWTVTSELQLIVARARDEGREPPVVIVHGVHWPFGRRDGYHDISAVPEAHRQPSAASGLLPTQGAPTDDGLWFTPRVATSEHGPANGVLTAVEDFVASDADRWRIVEVAGHHGCAVLATAALARTPDVAGLLAAYASPGLLRLAARRAEAGRLEALVAKLPPGGGQALTDARAELTALQTQLDRAVEDLQAREAELAELPALQAELEQARAHLAAAVTPQALRDAADLEAARWQVARLEDEVARRDVERREALSARDEQSRAAVEAVVRLERALADLEDVRGEIREAHGLQAQLREQLDAVAAERDDLADRHRTATARSAHLEEALDAARSEIRAGRNHSFALEAQIRLHEERVESVSGLVQAAAASRSWRWGHRLTRTARALTFRRSHSSDGALEAAVARLEQPMLPPPPAETALTLDQVTADDLRR